MRAIGVAVTWLIIAHASPALARQAQSSDPIVQVGVFADRADGSTAAAAFETESPLDSHVYASATLCQVGAGAREAPAWAMHAWRFSGRVLSKSPEQAVVELTWRRTLHSGDELPLPENVVQLTLRAGDRVALDTVAAGAESMCVAQMSFGVRYMARFSDAARRSGSGGPLTGSFARAPNGTSAAGGGVRTGSDGLSASQAGDRGPVQVDLWLVHSAPGRPDETLHQLVRAPREGGDYGFAPLTIETPGGPVVVQVNGSFGIASAQLTFITNRTVKYPGSSERPAADVQGSGRTVHPMPSPADVLSFEMPPILASPGGSALPNQLSVRVRIGR